MFDIGPCEVELEPGADFVNSDRVWLMSVEFAPIALDSANTSGTDSTKFGSGYFVV